MRITKANAEHISEMLTAKKTREAKKHHQETHQKIKDCFKEAAAYLWEKQNTALIVRKRL